MCLVRNNGTNNGTISSGAASNGSLLLYIGYAVFMALGVIGGVWEQRLAAAEWENVFCKSGALYLFFALLLNSYLQLTKNTCLPILFSLLSTSSSDNFLYLSLSVSHSFSQSVNQSVSQSVSLSF